MDELNALRFAIGWTSGTAHKATMTQDVYAACTPREKMAISILLKEACCEGPGSAHFGYLTEGIRAHETITFSPCLSTVVARRAEGTSTADRATCNSLNYN